MDPISVYNVAGVHFGIREDPEASALDGGEIHWLPPDPPWLAGLTVCSGRTLTLFDLAAALGLPPAARGPGRYRLFSSKSIPGSALLAAEGERVAAAGPSPVEKLPHFLRSEPVDRFIRQDGKPVPLIHTETLLHCMTRPGFRPRSAAFQISTPDKCIAASRPAFLAVSIGGQGYAIPAAAVVNRGRLSDVPLTPFQPAPDFVAGFCSDRNRAIPVIDPARRLALEGRSAPSRFLEVRCGEQHFRFLVEAVEATIADDSWASIALPALLRTAWRPAVLFDRSSFYPVLEPARLLALPPQKAPPTINRRAYRVESHFRRRFRRESLEVLEFDLGGRCHALPGMETEEPFAAGPVRPLQVSNPVVIGVAERNGCLLPVLDPAVCFGRRRRSVPDGWMIPVRNGDFQALVLTPRVYGSRRLPAAQQRRLPFEAGEDLVYGCYPHGAAVSLIFNTHALAENFDAARHVRLLESLAAVDTAAADPPGLSEEQRGDGAAVTTAPAAVPSIERPDRLRTPRATFAVKADRPVAGAIHSPVQEQCGRPAGVPAAQAEPIRPFPDAGPVAPSAEPPQTARRDWLPAVGCPCRLPAGRPPTRLPEVLPPAQRLAVHLPALQPSAVPFRRETPMRPALPAPENRPDEREQPPREPAAGSLPRELPTGRQPLAPEMPALPQLQSAPAAVQPGPAPAMRRAEQDAAVSEDVGAIPTSDARQDAEAEEVPQRAGPQGGDLPEMPDPLSAWTAAEPEEDLLQEDSTADGHRLPSRRHWMAVAAGMALLLLIGGYYFGDGALKAMGFKLRRAAGDAPGPAVSGTITPPPSEDGMPDRGPRPESASADREARGSASSDSSADRTVQIRITGKDGRTNVYEVKPGDTLWGISERYTGSGFNYPDVARENRIRNPDLIFPEQRIEVK